MTKDQWKRHYLGMAGASCRKCGDYRVRCVFSSVFCESCSNLRAKAA